MASLLTRRRGPDAAGRSAIAAILADPIFELLPLKSLPDQIPHLPAGARVSVTASPAKGIDATLDWAARLQGDGFRADTPPVGPDDRRPGRRSPACSTARAKPACARPSSSAVTPTSPASISTACLS